MRKYLLELWTLYMDIIEACDEMTPTKDEHKIQQAINLVIYLLSLVLAAGAVMVKVVLDLKAWYWRKRNASKQGPALS